MADNIQPVPLTPDSRADQVFPTLTPAQVARVHAHGRVRQVKSGEVLLEAGEQSTRFFVVTAGQLHIVRQTCESEELVAVFGQGPSWSPVLSEKLAEQGLHLLAPFHLPRREKKHRRVRFVPLR